MCRLPNLQSLLADLEMHFSSPNMFYAIRVEGKFESVRARAVKKQSGDRWASHMHASLLAVGLGLASPRPGECVPAMQTQPPACPHPRLRLGALASLPAGRSPRWHGSKPFSSWAR